MNDKAEASRKIAREKAKDCVAIYRPDMPKWKSFGELDRMHTLCDELEAAIKREEQYIRIIKKSVKPQKIKKCKTCAQRRLLRLAKGPFGGRSKFRTTNYEETKKIVASISECWPDFKRVPELLWNQYIDATGICRCGRPICPKRATRHPNVQDCCDQHTKTRRLRAWRAEKKRFAQERKAIEQEME